MEMTFKRKFLRNYFTASSLLVLISTPTLSSNAYAAQDSVQSSIIHNQNKSIVGCTTRNFTLSSSTQLNTGNCQGSASNATYTTVETATSVSTTNGITITCPGVYNLVFNDFGWWCNQYEWETANMYVYLNGTTIGSWPLSIPTSMGGAGTNCMSNNSHVQVAPAPAYSGNGPATINSFTVTASMIPARLTFLVINGGTSAGSCGAGGGSSNSAGMGWQIGTNGNKSNGATFTITRTGDVN